MRVLVSAYACEPDKGSEPEVGFQAMLAAASAHDTWVITRENNLPALRSYLDKHALEDKIHLVGLEIGGVAARAKGKGGLLTLHMYHHLWQRRLAELAVRLDADIDFDVIHHVTFATYWTSVGVAAVNKPLVWGPVGGAVTPPIGLLSVMGIKGAVGDVVRTASRPAIAKLNRARNLADRAAVVLVQNPEATRAMGNPPHAVVLPNGLVAARSITTPHPSSRSNIVTAGRLIGWKGAALAVAAMQHLTSGEVLDIYGSGPQNARLLRMVARLGLEGRVRLRGMVSRAELLSAVGNARLFLHPALHDDSPLTVAEALALGTPVVCLDRGGPPVLLGRWPEVPSRAVVPTTPADTAERLAAAMTEVIDQRAAANLRPGEVFTQGILDAYQAAISRS